MIVWLTQKAGARPVFVPFTAGRHSVPEDVAASLQQTCDTLGIEGFHVVANLFQTGQMKHVSTRVALLENSVTAELALAVAMFTAARPTRLVASYAELPTKFRDGRSVSVHNSPLAGSFTPPPSRIVVRLPIVRDPARLCRIKRAYLDRHYRGVERVPFEHQGEPARFLGEAMARELTEQVEAGTWRRDNRAGVFRPTFPSAWVMTWQALPPFSMVRRRRVRRRAAAILRELNMTGPDPAPSRCPARPCRSGGWWRSPSLSTSSPSSARACSAPRGRFLPTSWYRPPSPTRCARSSDLRAGRPRRLSAPTRSATPSSPRASP